MIYGITPMLQSLGDAIELAFPDLAHKQEIAIFSIVFHQGTWQYWCRLKSGDEISGEVVNFKVPKQSELN